MILNNFIKQGILHQTQILKKTNHLLVKQGKFRSIKSNFFRQEHQWTHHLNNFDDENCDYHYTSSEKQYDPQQILADSVQDYYVGDDFQNETDYH